jgi:hypothetical protein
MLATVVLAVTQMMVAEMADSEYNDDLAIKSNPLFILSF